MSEEELLNQLVKKFQPRSADRELEDKIEDFEQTAKQTILKVRHHDVEAKKLGVL